MDNFDFNPNFDFHNLDVLELNKRKISHKEILSVYKNVNSIYSNLDGFPLEKNYFKIIGFSSSSRFLLLALEYEENNIIFHQVEIANENDIKTQYCGK